MTTDLIISVEDFREVCQIKDAFDSDYLTSFIDQSTDLAGQNVLGTALLIKMINDYNSNTLTGLYAELWDSRKCSVKKMVSWQTYQLALPRMLFKIGAATITDNESENLTAIDSNDLGLMIRQADATRVNYENRVKEFLTTNYSSIPELQDSTPNYKPANTSKVDTSQGMSFSPNITYTNF